MKWKNWYPAIMIFAGGGLGYLFNKDHGFFMGMVLALLVIIGYYLLMSRRYLKGGSQMPKEFQKDPRGYLRRQRHWKGRR